MCTYIYNIYTYLCVGVCVFGCALASSDPPNYGQFNDRLGLRAAELARRPTGFVCIVLCITYLVILYYIIYTHLYLYIYIVYIIYTRKYIILWVPYYREYCSIERMYCSRGYIYYIGIILYYYDVYYLQAMTRHNIIDVYVFCVTIV